MKAKKLEEEAKKLNMKALTLNQTMHGGKTLNATAHQNKTKHAEKQQEKEMTADELLSEGKSLGEV